MSKNKVLEDPTAYKTRSCSRNFIAPRKERATTGGPFMTPGDSYGVGFRNPIGTEKVSGMKSGPIPQESVCFPSEEALRK